MVVVLVVGGDWRGLCRVRVWSVVVGCCPGGQGGRARSGGCVLVSRVLMVVVSGCRRVHRGYEF